MTGWTGFWIMIGLISSTEVVVEFLKWKWREEQKTVLVKTTKTTK